MVAKASRNNGLDDGDFLGYSVSGVGDINGDGIDDVIIGAIWADPYGLSQAGESYALFGSRDNIPLSLDLTSLDGTNGFPISGIDADDSSGVSVSGAGDVNGDGVDDLVIGAYGATPNDQILAGESYVVFGQAAACPIDELEALIDEVEAIDEGMTDSLLKALERLTDKNTHNDISVCGQLKVFISQVNAAERNSDLTAEQATTLRDPAEQIIEALDCG